MTILVLPTIASTQPLFADSVAVAISSEDGKYALTEKEPFHFASKNNVGFDDKAVYVDSKRTYHSILGIGASLEHATCYNLSVLDEGTRKETIEKIVSAESGIGMNLMRICIGTSDFVGEPWYSYDDLEEGKIDPNMEKFSIEKDRRYVLPTLKTALRKNPDLLFVASPWSPPGWMKTNGSMLAGKLKPEFYDAFALYLVKFIRAYEAEGIPIHAITTQNEPNYPNSEYPTCHWTAEEQRDFIRNHLGPLFEKENMKTEIWCWDHNWNNLDFPRTVLSDPIAGRYVSGTAFHLYEGSVEAQSVLHNEFPDKDIYFTEGSTFATDGAVEIIDMLRNWSRSYNAWVLLLDEHRKPNNGPHHADATPIELLDDGSLRYNFEYYMYGQFSKFIRRGAERIHTESERETLSHIGFKNPDNTIVLVVANPAAKDRTLTVVIKSKTFRDIVPGKSVATYRWKIE